MCNRVSNIIAAIIKVVWKFGAIRQSYDFKIIYI